MHSDDRACDPHPLGRRAALGLGSAALAWAATACTAREPDTADAAPPAAVPGQVGIANRQPRHVLLTSFDVLTKDAARLTKALRDWAVETDATNPGAAAAGGTTATVAALPTLYKELSLPAPSRLQDPPPFPGDRLEPARSGGALLVQWCGGTPDDCARAAGEFTAGLGSLLNSRWRQSGFLPPTPQGATPRNLFGFKDGTENPPENELGRWVWRAGGATYLVYRRIHMEVRRFNALPVPEQEQVIGRGRTSGAPLGGRAEHDAVDLFAKTPQGRYVVPADSHVRLAHSRLDGGARMLRRGYNYDDGANDQGLLFLAYMNDPALFTRVQQRLAEQDALTRFTEHRASAVGYVLPPFGKRAAPRWS